MAATIRSSIAAKPTITGASREDLRSGDVVTLEAPDPHTTYSWTLSFTPLDESDAPSAAVLSSTTGPGPITFTIDNEGSYLVRLVVDAGLGATEDTQFVRLRYQTIFGNLRLVSAGERRDATGIIPIDASAEGWANDQNYNLLVLMGFTSKVSTSGRTFFVDANRGQDIANTPNDETIAEGYGDYSTISAAIVAANALVPAPSLSNPAVIKVHPGLYEENVAFASHVHVQGITTPSTDELDRTVVVRTTGGGEHSAAITGAGEFCYVGGLLLENATNNTSVVLRKTGAGALLLHRNTMVQNGNDASQGPVYSHDGGSVLAKECRVISNNTTGPTRHAIEGDTTSTSMVWDDCDIVGPSGVDLAPSNLPSITAAFRRCRIDSAIVDAAAYTIRSNADQLTLEYCELTISGGVSTRVVDIHPDAGVHGTDIIVDLRWSRVDGGIFFDDTGVVGSTRLRKGASDYGTITLPGGALTENSATVEGTSIFFDNTASSISSETSQEAIDHLFSVIGVTGLGGSALSLDTAYDGILDITVPSFGVGSGRTIQADSGAVTIQGAAAPVSPPDLAQATGQLHVESNVQVGAIGAPEIDLDPNPFGIGPLLLGGRLLFPDVAAGVHRAIPAMVVGANSTNSPLFHSYNLLLQTESEADASRDEIGRILLKAGDSIDGGGTPPHAGQVYAQAGDSHDTTGDPGEIWLSPGRNAVLAIDGRVKLTCPSTATVASLTAGGVFVGGTGGAISFYVSGVGLQVANILVGDTLADVQTKLNALTGLSCVINPANDPIQVTTQAKGANAEVYFIQDDQGGSTNTALGDFTIGGGAAFAPGTFPDVAGLACTAADELTVYDDLVVNGGITSGGAICHNRKTIAIGDSPYAVLDTDHYIGVDSSGGAVIIDLPTTATGAKDGRELIIKDESGDAAANPITIQIAGGALIDSAASLALSADHAATTMVANGLTGASTRFFIT